ncbi:hypothetical protein BFZC1_05028 [Lysinibacillus fusiformis ZC1]|nr:hypothetical protein BFZC1_05028 [Lysinibacillus fusiformis ZC1]
MPKRVWFLIIGMLVNTTGNSFFMAFECHLYA